VPPTSVADERSVVSDDRGGGKAERDERVRTDGGSDGGGTGVDDDDDGDGGAADGGVRVVVRHGGDETVTRAAVGTTLRDHLLEHGLSPYARLTERANCGGNGLCATCGVRIPAGEPDPTHWHDRLAARFGYPRLSCQIRIRGPMVVELVDDKRVWGGRE
jgi:ferredoxin